MTLAVHRRGEMTPLEWAEYFDKAIAKARSDALEEAARVAEIWKPDGKQYTCDAIAAAIRALATK